MSEQPSLEAVKAYLLDLQDRICAAFEAADGRSSGKVAIVW